MCKSYLINVIIKLNNSHQCDNYFIVSCNSLYFFSATKLMEILKFWFNTLAFIYILMLSDVYWIHQDGVIKISEAFFFLSSSSFFPWFGRQFKLFVFLYNANLVVVNDCSDQIANIKTIWYVVLKLMIYNHDKITVIIVYCIRTCIHAHTHTHTHTHTQLYIHWSVWYAFVLTYYSVYPTSVTE